MGWAGLARRIPRARSRPRAQGGGPPIELSVRHSELLLLLATHPSGLSADRMAVLLHEYEVAAVTIRAELNRLRRILGPETIGSRPSLLPRADPDRP